MRSQEELMAEEEEEVVEKGGGKKKLFIIIGGVLALAAGAFFFLGGGDDAAAEEPVEPEVVEGEVLEVGSLTIVLADQSDDGSLRYVRVGLALVLDELADSSTVAGKVSLMQDAAISVLSEMTTGDLRGASGADDARSRLTAAAQEIYPDGEVVRVVLTEMLLQ
jgi:flagellar basal body-associated protein FliL